MSEKYKDLEGAVDVNGDITPTTRQKIGTVTGDEWSEMSVSELYNQRSVLIERLNYASSIAPTMVPVLQQGIARLDAHIRSKTNDNDTGLI